MRSGFTWTFAAILLLAVFARALVPTGYMLTSSDDGRFVSITLCTGYGPADAVLDFRTGTLADAADHPAGSVPDGGQGTACPFATFAHAALPALPPAAPVVAFREIPPTVQPVDDAPVAGALAALPWATGPPRA
ncbi:DUF2946 family protein [Kordiimonas sp.]|uniref:DUF2946 family protein n=1 Tax=Kordiimonas sp. TaxID=1970157 RepID=UPI003A94D636